MFTVVTDQHSAAISVQAVDDAGYSLTNKCPLWAHLGCIIGYVQVVCNVYIFVQAVNHAMCVYEPYKTSKTIVQLKGVLN